MSQSTYTFDGGTNLKDGALTKLAEKRVWPQMVRNHFMWSRFGQKRGPEVNSRKREITLRIYDGQVSTFGTESGVLPRSRPESEIRAEYGFTKMLRGFSFTPEAMEQMKQPSSLMGLAERLDAYGEAIQHEMARFFYGNGSAAVAAITATPTLSAGVYTVTVDDASDSWAGVGSRGTADIKVGSDYDLVLNPTSSNSIAARLLVTNITSATTFKGTLVAGIGSADPTLAISGSIVVPPGSRPAGTTTSYAFHGIGYHLVDSTTTEWQSLTTIPLQLRAVVKDMNGASLTIGYANYIEDACRQRRANVDTGGTDNTLIIASIGQHAKLKQQLNSYRRADMGATTLTTGGVDVANQFGNKWVTDPACPDSRLFNLDESDFSMAVLKELSYVDNGNDGKMTLRPYGSGDTFYHIYDGWFQMLFEFVCRTPSKQAALIDLGVSDIIKASETAYTF